VDEPTILMSLLEPPALPELPPPVSDPHAAASATNGSAQNILLIACPCLCL
jgi:hypothetical protein